MLLPMALASLSLLAALIAVRRRIGRIAIATAAGWLLIDLILGSDGLRYLF